MKEIKVLSRSSFLAQIQTHLAIKKIKTIFKGPISIQYTESIGDTDTSSKPLKTFLSNIQKNPNLFA